MNLNVLKGVQLLGMIIGTMVLGLLPLKVLKALRYEAAHAPNSTRHQRISLILCLLTCFSGGVFLATCFLHLFPELVENVQNLDTRYNIHIDYPVAELLSCLGFFLLFFLEEIVIMAIPALAHGHSHGHSKHHADHEDHEHEHKQPAAPTGGCCMTDLVQVAPEPEETKNVAESISTTADETTRLTKEDEIAEGHCQTHCPLTAHVRSSITEECQAPAPKKFVPLAFAEPERCEVNCDAVDEDPPILMKSRPHLHSHGIRSITFVLALSIHSIIEGLAFGVMSSPTETTALFFSLLIHKLIVAFSVGLQLARTHAHQLKWVVASMFTLSLMTPIGGVIGMVLTSATAEALWKDVTITILQGLAVGTFLYVTFFEVLLHERDNEHPNLMKLAVMMLGFGLIGLLRVFDSHDHAHGAPLNSTISAGHGHSHD